MAVFNGKKKGKDMSIVYGNKYEPDGGKRCKVRSPRRIGEGICFARKDHAGDHIPWAGDGSCEFAPWSQEGEMLELPPVVVTGNEEASEGAEACRARKSGYVCTATKGHAGDHIPYGAEDQAWPQGDKPVKAKPAVISNEYEPDPALYCRAVDPRGSGYQCEARRGHEGDHIAWVSDGVRCPGVADWPQAGISNPVITGKPDGKIVTPAPFERDKTSQCGVLAPASARTSQRGAMPDYPCRAAKGHAGDHQPYLRSGATASGCKPWPQEVPMAAERKAYLAEWKRAKKREADRARSAARRAAAKEAEARLEAGRAAAARTLADSGFDGERSYRSSMYAPGYSRGSMYSLSGYEPLTPKAVTPEVPAVVTKALAAAAKAAGTSVLADVVGQMTMPSLAGPLTMLAGRKTEIGGDLPVLLMAVAMTPDARAAMSAAMDVKWAAEPVPAGLVGELIIGGGVHSAVYAAARVAAGHPKPWVLSASPGGVFGMSDGPAFWLNSRNQPGGLSSPVITTRGGTGLPVTEQGLNVLPGAPLQAAMLPGGEFQPNHDMAYIVRVTLAKSAHVITGTVVKVRAGTIETQVDLADGRTIRVRRLIDARGLGDPKAPGDGDTIMTFPQLMKSMSEPFPLRGMTRVAVVGNGDAARCAAEALLGISPAPAMTGLDYVQSVDWYGPGLPQTRVAWRDSERGRYQRLGSDLPANPEVDPLRRLRILDERGDVVRTLGQVIVSGRYYDKAIMCTGFTRPQISGLDDTLDFDPYTPPTTQDPYSYGGSLITGRKAYGKDIWKIGPAADIPFSDREITDGIAARTANKAGIFRLAGRTAALATTLPAPQ
jgi:hypothetical protein